MRIKNINNIEALCKQHGADLIGIAPVERFTEAPEGFSPSDILSTCKSIIILLCEFPKDAVKGYIKPELQERHWFSKDELMIKEKIWDNSFGIPNKSGRSNNCFIRTCQKLTYASIGFPITITVSGIPFTLRST